ncbi:uncharacterized protein LOC115885027 [Sitophilus oryzae]|uniref:Uncharacterized protein LOC115885027 n=1 Tax=Sitophilus oryzae TaxID=7048 RepID=A0A6J2Y8X5_SITOR|nr:uncharacterized protein LOC115885027 [Sitophilus oryzae]
MSELSDTEEKNDIRIKVSGDHLTFKERLKQHWQLLTKILELVICIICLGFIMEPAKKGDMAKIHLDHFCVIFTTFIGYLVISAVFLFARIIGDKIPYKTVFIFSVTASCLFFISGILLAIDRKRRYFYDDTFYEPRMYILNFIVVSTFFSFLACVVFVVESVYIWKLGEEF